MASSCETGPRPVAERESWELSCCPSGVQKIGIGKSGNSFLFINRR